ncbi:MAG: hydantoinase B/oxoprolinase family protein [Gammaproteobacteria bacterium]|nr:hydantoinase B/oxoprolinase family protein [Gammaproteobacteria bacterium]
MTQAIDAIQLSIFSNRVNAICDEMGAILRRASFSPNIKDRLDFSCAIFDASGELCAQAAHIPVHLGSMAYAMRDIVADITWQSGDMLILNDPFLGGTHLPDVTLIAPLFLQNNLFGFIANRAHHADMGADTPGSMPNSKSLYEEGVVIAPSLLVKNFVVDESMLSSICQKLARPEHARGDFVAQVSANRIGLQRLQVLIESLGLNTFPDYLIALNSYAETLARQSIETIPNGEYQFIDFLDDDGQGQNDIQIQVTIKVNYQNVLLDFSGTAKQVSGNVNCPLSVAAAAAYYVFRCLMPDFTPACAGAFRPIQLHVESGSLLNATRPAAVAAGNVETSTRVVDVIMGALLKAIPEQMAAASHGSMNNVAMGARDSQQHWDYYETIGGGAGASPRGPGQSAVQTHMTNTLNTPVESLEMHYPLRVLEYSIRKNSGGLGEFNGGDGLIRRFEFLQAASVSLLSERRRHSPWGVNQGSSGAPGLNQLNQTTLPGKCEIKVQTGDVLSVATPGGGAWGLNKQKGK